MSTLYPRGGYQFRLVVILICLNSAQAIIAWISKPENRSLATGQDLILSCQAVSVNESDLSVSLSFQWYFNDSKVQDKLARFSNNSLFVPNLAEQDFGFYTCFVSRIKRNYIGDPGFVLESVSASGLVIKSYIDPFLLQPTSVFAGLGDTVVLTCVTGRSSPDIEVRWLRNGQEFQKGSQQVSSFGDYDVTGLSVQLSMKLTLVTSQDIYGSYVCQAKNQILSKTVWSQKANITYIGTPGGNLPVILWNLPASLILREGLNFILPCLTEPSKELPRVSWYRGGSPVPVTGTVFMLSNNSLGFFPFHTINDGNYSCVAVNSAGQTQSPNISLTAAYLAVTFNKQPSDLLSLLGNNVTLMCEPPDSSPAANVSWYKDYSIVNSSSNRIRTIGHNLLLPSIQYSDAGVYYCVASNNLTSPSTRTSTTATLTVQGPPIIRVPPLNTRLIRGKPLQLTCQVDANPSPETTWLFGGRAVTLSNKVTLIEQGQVLWISDVGKEWDGQFTCVSSNKFGKISADAFVTVIAPPVSLQSIGDLVSNVGDSIDIPCYVVSDPQPSILWFFNGKGINQSNKSSSALRVDYVTAKLAGVYTCLGFNEAGNASSSGSLMVNAAPFLSVPLKDVTAVIGHYVTLTCEFDGLPVPSVYWLFNSSSAGLSNARSSNYNRTLTIGPVTWSNQGVYTCASQNVVGRAESSSFLTVNVPPDISSINFPQAPVKIYTKFVLSCTAFGIPSPLTQWVFQNQTVQSSSNGRVTVTQTGELVVTFALRSDSGLYECWAMSSAGQDHRTATVIVYGAPPPPSLLSTSPVTSDSIILVWAWSDLGDAASRVDQFQISYRERLRSGATAMYPTMYSANETQAVVSGLKAYTAYVFYVSAVNDAGIGDSSNPLTVVTNQSSPSSPINVLVSNISSNTATLRWEQPTVANGVIRLYQLIFKAENSNSDFVSINITSPQLPSVEIFISPLLPYTQYTAQVRAANIENGRELWGSFSPYLTFQTLASKPTSPPQNVQGVAVDPYSIQVAWQAIPTARQNGPILYYNITCQDINSQLRLISSVDKSVTNVTIFGLLPWRQYSIQVFGVNEAGAGPAYVASSVWTLPLAPIAAPTELKISQYFSRSLQLIWKPLAVSLQTCNITAYRLQYRVQGNIEWLDHLIPSNLSSLYSGGFVGFFLDSLMPWTLYQLRVAVVCEAVSPGTGPFTYPVSAQTLQEISSPVTNVSYDVGSDSILLSWQPPNYPRGEVTGYEVSLQVKNSSPVTNVTNLVMTTFTTVTLESLHPETNYSISLVAVNKAGAGEPVFIKFKTTAQSTSVQPQATELSTEHLTVITYETTNVTGFFLAQQNDLPIKQNLAAIVAGSIVGTIALVIFTVFVCIKCIKYRKKQRLNYAVNTESENGDPVSTYRPLESATSPAQSFTPSLIVTDCSVTKSAQVTKQQSDWIVTTTQPYPPSALTENVPVIKEEDSNFSSPNIIQEKQKQKGHLSLPKLSISHAYSKLEEDMPGAVAQDVQGYDNLGFASHVTKEKKSSSFLSIPSTSAVNFDTDSISSETLQRKHRMRIESAAAIAFMRSHQGLPIDDIDVLIENEIESEVIFNERTAL
ncbi:hypothetical protein Btru_010921 [Bulinus truncatus]|nr:hypothetical protein Btru_010921 [Bulinus truncatus]